MEGSYDPVFAGPSTPISPGAPTGANQYKANVNRTKTRKWVEARTVDYGGDDWGGDFDDEPDEPEQQQQQAQPPPKPQGLRSPATFSNSQSPSSPAGPRPLQTTGPAVRAVSPAVSSSSGARTPLGPPALQIQTQQHPANQPPTTDIGSPWRQGPPSLGNTSGPERPRDISPHTVGVPQGATASSVYSAVAEFGQLYGDRAASPGPFQGPRPRRMSPGPQSASSTVPTRFPGRKSSLGQHDAPPDNNLYSPIHGDNTRQSGSRPGSSHANAGAIMSPNKPWMVGGSVGGPRSASPSGSMRSPTATGKPLPFVRPADIYKKLEEEKEKVRRSIDSGRPSMDSLGLAPAKEKEAASSVRAQSPAGTSENKPQTHEQGQARPDPDVVSPGLKGVTTDVPLTDEIPVDPNGVKATTPGREDDDTVMPRNGRSGLPTVAERKSEYGIEGLIASYEARGGTPGGTSASSARSLAAPAESASVPASREGGVLAVASPSSRLSPRHESGEDQVLRGPHATHAAESEQKEGAERDEALGDGYYQKNEPEAAHEGKETEDVKQGQSQSGDELRRLSSSPKLPELGRLSVFGFDLFSPSTSSRSQASPSPPENLTSSPSPPVPSLPSTHTLVSPSSPLSTVIESPSSPSALPASTPDGFVGQTQEVQPGQASRVETGPHPDPGAQLPSSPSHSVPGPQSSGTGDTSSGLVSQHASLQQSRSSPEQHGCASGDPNSNSRPSSAGKGPAAEPPKRPESAEESLADLHAAVRSVTSKSVPEHQPSKDKALPALPTELPVVTSGLQPSQLAISSPTPVVLDEQRSSDGESPSTVDPKLTVHPLLVQHGQKVKELSLQASTGDSSHATSAADGSHDPAADPTPVENQSIPPANLPAPLGTAFPSTSADNAANVGTASNDRRLSHEGGPELTIAQEDLTANGSPRGSPDATAVTPTEPSSARPPPPVEVTRGETFVTAVETPSLLTDDGSPTKSDKLSAEILRSLSPASPNKTAAADPSATRHHSSAGPSGAAARESSFLPDLYDDYWSFAGSGNASDANATPGAAAPSAADAMPAALKVQADDARPRSSVDDRAGAAAVQAGPAPSPPAATPRSSVDVYKTDVQAVPVELHRPVLPNRFSWEQDGIEGAKVDIHLEPKSLVDKKHAFSGNETPETEADTRVITSAEPKSRQSRTASPSPGHEDKDKAVTGLRPASPTSTFTPSNIAAPAAADESAPGSQFGVHPGPLSSNPVKTWQEIMAVPSQTDRIAEFNKARSHYAAAETGLPTILEGFASQHPDIVEASRAGGPTPAAFTYQAQSDQDAAALVSPTALGTTPAASTRHHSHPTAQLGAKSKELFATAGKASKGFFSTLKAKGKKVAN